MEWTIWDPNATESHRWWVEGKAKSVFCCFTITHHNRQRQHTAISSRMLFLLKYDLNCIIRQIVHINSGLSPYHYILLRFPCNLCIYVRNRTHCREMYIIKLFISFLVLNLSFGCPPYHAVNRGVVTVRFDSIQFHSENNANSAKEWGKL